jgi:hypothetical protein
MGYWDKEFAETRARVMARQEMERQAAQRQQAEFMAKLEIPMLEPGTESMWHGYWQLDMSLLSPPVTPTYNYPELLQSTSARAMDGYFGVLQPYPNPVYAQDTSLASSRIDIDPLPPGSAAFYATEEYFGSVQPYLNPDDSNRDGENASLISPGGIKFTNPYAPRSASKREFQENAP